MWFNRSNRLPAFVFPLTFFLLFVALVFLASTQAPAVHAGSTITVNTTTDELNPADGTCSLREAVIAANTNASSGGGAGECIAGSAGLDTIRVPAGTYTLAIAGTGEDNAATGDLDIREDLAIQGATAATTKIDANGIDRVFDVLNSAHATFLAMTIEGGNVPGSFPNDTGGGVRVITSTTASLTNILFIANYAGFAGGGLYVYPGAAATVNNSSFANNSAFAGGSIENDGTMTVTSTSFSWWSITSAADYGGALYNFGPATLRDVTFMNLMATQGGGAVYAIGAPLELNRVTIMSNTVTSGNGGGISAAGPMTLTNVTLSNNTASGNGGALFRDNFSGIVTLVHTTVYSNSAASGGGISNVGTGGDVVLQSSILYAGASGGNCNGAPTSEGYNLDSGNTCGLNATGDITNTNPMLGLLANNGGPTETHALLFGSPAIDRIPIGTNGCGTTITMDQRRFPRPMGPQCDMGAYEAVPRLLLPLILK